MDSLVGYSSESEEPPAKRRQAVYCLWTLSSYFLCRKLPPISPSLSPPAPIDNPPLHQGRIRTIPHVEGQFAAHVCLSLPLSRQSELYKLVQEIFLDAKEAVPTLREIWPDQSSCQRPELHISLSRPISLRAHQREELKRSVKNIAHSQKP
jgi:U6 snRNA phosphodiesterase